MLAQLLQHEKDSRQARGDQAACAGLSAITREQYLQHRKNTAQVFRRKAIVPGALFIVTFIVMSWMRRKEIQPSTLNELALYCLPLTTFVISLVWFCVIGRRDDKLNVIRCAACGKDNGHQRVSRWLIASGNCFYCHEKMFQDASAALNTTDDKPLISCAKFEEHLKATASQLNKVGLLVVAPLTAFLIWMAFQSTPLDDMEYLSVPVALLATFTVVLLLWLSFRIEKQSGAKCGNCGVFPSHYTKKIVLATGGCTSCGHRLFDNQELHRDTQMAVST